MSTTFRHRSPMGLYLPRGPATFVDKLLKLPGVTEVYPLNDVSGSTANELVHGGSGSYLGGYTLGQLPLVSGTGRSTIFDGNNGEASLTVNGTGQTSGWVCWTWATLEATSVLIRNATSTGGTGTFFQLASLTGAPTMRVAGTDQGITGVNSALLRDGNRHTGFFVFDGGAATPTAYLYLDGVLALSWARATTWASIVGGAGSSTQWHMARNGSSTGSSNYYVTTYGPVAHGQGSSLPSSDDIANLQLAA